MYSLFIYLFAFFWITLFYKLSIKMKKNKNYILHFLFKLISFGILVFFICFRYGVGTDYFNYMEHYEYYGTVKLIDIFKYRMEPGSLLLYKLSYLISKNPITVVMVISFLICLSLYILLTKIEDFIENDEDAGLSLISFLLLFLPFCLNGMRQGIAIIFGLISILYFIQKKGKSCILYFLLALSFHSSAILILIYLILLKFMKNKNTIKYTIIFTLIIGVILLSAPLLLSNISFLSKYRVYLNSNVSTINKSYIILLILNIPLTVLMITERKKIKEKYNILISLWLSSQILYFFSSFFIFLNRISLYFEVISIILIPTLFKSNNKENRFISKCACCLYLIIYFYIHFYVFGSHQIFPYRNMLFS